MVVTLDIPMIKFHRIGYFTYEPTKFTKSYIVLLLDTNSPYSVPLCISTTINTNCRIGLYMKELRTVLNVAVGGMVEEEITTMTTT